MQRSSTPRHKARDFKTNLVLISLPLLVLWSVLCYLAISTIVSIERNSLRLTETNLPYIKSAFEADYALSNVVYKIELMARSNNQELLRENYLKSVEVLNDAELEFNPTIQKEALILTQNIGKLYELRKVLAERSEQINFAWMRHYASIDNVYLLTGDFNSSRKLVTQDIVPVSSGAQLLLPVVSQSMANHRREVHPKCMAVFELRSRQGHQPSINPEHRFLQDILESNASLQEKLLYACNGYETSYGTLQDLLYDEAVMRQHFHSVYLSTLNRIDHIRTQSTDVRFGVTERIAAVVLADSQKLFSMLMFGGLCVLLSTIWLAGSVWYLYFIPIRRMNDLVRDFNITYRIPDPREVSLKEMQVILANMRPTLMEVRSIKQKNRYLKELNTKLGQISYLDGLTQLHNRRALEEVIKRRPNLNNHSAVFMIDIDHFKLFNDSEGHQAGDETLRAVARTIKANLTHSKDMVYRYGGEEFCVILTCIDYKGTVDLADRIVSAVENLHIRNSGINGYVTISLGISFYAGAYAGDMESSIVQHIRWADAALYIAKRRGRNQSRVYKTRKDLYFESNPREARYYEVDEMPPKDEPWTDNEKLTGEAVTTSRVNNPEGADAAADTMALYDAMSQQKKTSLKDRFLGLFNKKGFDKNVEGEQNAKGDRDVKTDKKGVDAKVNKSAEERTAAQTDEFVRADDSGTKPQSTKVLSSETADLQGGSLALAIASQEFNNLEPASGHLGQSTTILEHSADSLAQPTVTLEQNALHNEVANSAHLELQADSQSDVLNLQGVSAQNLGRNQQVANKDSYAEAQLEAVSNIALKSGTKANSTSTADLTSKAKSTSKGVLKQGQISTTNATKVSKSSSTQFNTEARSDKSNVRNGKAEVYKGSIGVNNSKAGTIGSNQQGSSNQQGKATSLSSGNSRATRANAASLSKPANVKQQFKVLGVQSGNLSGDMRKVESRSKQGRTRSETQTAVGQGSEAIKQGGISQERNVQAQSSKRVMSPQEISAALQERSASPQEVIGSLPRRADGRLDINPNHMDELVNPENILQEAHQERANLTTEQAEKYRLDMEEIKNSLPQAYDYDSNGFYNDDYEEDMIVPDIPNNSALETDGGEQVISDLLPKRREDSDFIQIYYGDTPVPIKNQTSNKSR